MPWLAPQQQQQQQAGSESLRKPDASAAASRHEEKPVTSLRSNIPEITPNAIQEQQQQAAAPPVGLQSSSSSNMPRHPSCLSTDDDGLSIHPGVLQLPFHAQPHSQPGSAGCSYNGAAAATGGGVDAHGRRGSSSGSGNSSSSKWFAWNWVQRRSSLHTGAPAVVAEEQQQQQQQYASAGDHAARSMRATLEDRLLLAAVSVTTIANTSVSKVRRQAFMNWSECCQMLGPWTSLSLSFYAILLLSVLHTAVILLVLPVSFAGGFSG
jgi:hypothetical protein